MAKGDVTLKFDAQTAQYVQECLKARDALMATADATRKLGAESSKAGDSMSKSFEGVAHRFGLITTAAGAAQAGIALTLKSATDMFNELNQRADAFHQRIQTLSSALSSKGQLSQYGAVSKQIGEMAQKDVGGAMFSQGELTRVYASISAQEGSKATPKQILAGVEQYKRGRAAAMDEGDAIDLGIKATKLSGVGLEDMAYAAHVSGFDEGDERIVNRAKNKRSAMMTIMAAKKVEEGPRVLQALEAEAALLDEDPRTLSKEQRKQRQKLRHLVPAGEDPITALLDHPEILQDEKLREAARSIARGAKEYASGGVPSLAAAMDAAEDDPQLRRVLWKRRNEVKEERAKGSTPSEWGDAKLAAGTMKADRALDYRWLPEFVRENVPLPRGEHAKDDLDSPWDYEGNWVGYDRRHQAVVSSRANAGQAENPTPAQGPDAGQGSSLGSMLGATDLLRDINGNLTDIHRTLQTTPVMNRTHNLATSGREDSK